MDKIETHYRHSYGGDTSRCHRDVGASNMCRRSKVATSTCRYGNDGTGRRWCLGKVWVDSQSGTFYCHSGSVYFTHPNVRLGFRNSSFSFDVVYGPLFMASSV